MELENIPLVPGVYLMSAKDKIIYVGKAKNLKNRVSSYFNRTLTDIKTIELVKNVEKIDYIITNSEADALILENNLIKKYKPKYNIMLKDEKSYPYIFISKEKYSKVLILRTTKSPDTKIGDYFGPFPMSVYGFIKIIKKIFKIRDCNRDMDKIYERPCLKFYMKMCDGPCINKNIESEYQDRIESLKKILKGDINLLINDLTNKMSIFSKNLEYENAMTVRNMINEINKIASSQVCEYAKGIDEDIAVMIEESEKLYFLVLNVREGKVIGKNFIKGEKKAELESFEIVISSYYENKTVPKSIIIQEKYEQNMGILIEWFKKYKGKNIEIHAPKIKSRRKELLIMAEKNLEEEIFKINEEKRRIDEGVKKLYTTLSLKRIPYKIECFDISNIQGKDAVGSMSVSVNGKASKKDYRRFKIMVKDTPDDFEMMREVITRRYTKLEPNEMPDMILVDGGKGQLAAAVKILEEIGKDGYSDIVSIAKKEELLFKNGIETPFVINKKDESIKIIQRVRDEAHRFGITYHRKLRKKRVISSELDGIDGIGPKRRQELLKKFGSVSEIKKATFEELKEVVPEVVAERILKLRKEKIE